jgi:ribosomal 50S subunit-recycling heat shock protein
MRLDKFLQTSRLVKRRALANRLCDAGKVMVNGKKAKAAAEVAVGDLIGLTLGNRRLVVRVRHLPSGRPLADKPIEVVSDEVW